MAGYASQGPAGHAPRLAVGDGPEQAPPSRKRDGGPGIDGGAGNAALASSLAASRGDLVRSVLSEPGRPVGGDVEALFRDTTGGDASGIVVHEGPEAAEAAASVEARMFASGRHIVAPDGLDVTSREGVFSTVHEIHHIVNQQAKGDVDGTDTGDGLSISDPADRFEQEADAVAALAVEQTFE